MVRWLWRASNWASQYRHACWTLHKEIVEISS